MLNAVLMCCKPPEWEVANYSTSRYRLFDLQQGDAEYAKEIGAFHGESPRINVLSLQRVQNPYQLGPFLTRQEQLRSRNETADVVKCYHPIKRVDLEVALEFNMDIRRYTYKVSGNNNGKTPSFYKTPGAAANSVSEVNEKAIIVCNVLGRLSDMENVNHKINSAEYMPTYVACIA